MIPPRVPGSRDDLIFFLADRQDEHYRRLNKKIEGLRQRITALEEREGLQ